MTVFLFMHYVFRTLRGKKKKTRYIIHWHTGLAGLTLIVGLGLCDWTLRHRSAEACACALCLLDFEKKKIVTRLIPSERYQPASATLTPSPLTCKFVRNESWVTGLNLPTAIEKLVP